MALFAALVCVDLALAGEQPTSSQTPTATSASPVPKSSDEANSDSDIVTYQLNGGVSARPSDSSVKHPKEPWPGLARPRVYDDQRSYGVFASALFLYGLGLGAHVGTPRLGLEVGGGFRPVIATYTPPSGDNSKVKLLGAWQVAAVAYVGLYRLGPRTDFGLLAGYGFNTVTLHAAGPGLYLQYDLSSKFALQLETLFAYAPEADRRIREKWSLPTTGGSVGGGLANLQSGGAVTFIWFT